jgi:hypothetical protein
MVFKLFLFSKIAIFFLGITIIVAYLIHRLVFMVNSKRLSRLFPTAFESCFDLVKDFYDIIEESPSAEIDRFLTKVISRKNLNLPGQFRDLPIPVVRSAYSHLKRFREEYKNNPELIMRHIRDSIYKEYFSTYKRRVLNESLNWLLILIPFAFASGILLPLIFYFYFPVAIKNWPILLSLAGLAIGAGTVYLIVKDYYLKR